jgi:hypothetical protein
MHASRDVMYRGYITPYLAYSSVARPRVLSLV